MKIIIDANCAHKLHAADVDGQPVLRKLLSGKLSLCLSESLKAELFRTPISEIYKDLALSGLIMEVEETQINAVSVGAVCQSNDLHIISLALAAHCRLLFSNDRALHADFTNAQILNNPRGKVYQNIGHARLLPT